MDIKKIRPVFKYGWSQCQESSKLHYKIISSVKVDLSQRKSKKSQLIKPFKTIKSVLKLYLYDTKDRTSSATRKTIKYFHRFRVLIKKEFFDLSFLDTKFLKSYFKPLKRLDRIDFHIQDNVSNDKKEVEDNFKKLAIVLKKQNPNILNIFSAEPLLFTENLHLFPQNKKLGYYSNDYSHEVETKPFKVNRIRFKLRYAEDSYGEYIKNYKLAELLGEIACEMKVIVCWEYYNEEPKISPFVLEKVQSSWEQNSTISDLANLRNLSVEFPIPTQKTKMIIESLPDLSRLVDLKIKGSLKYEDLNSDLCSLLIQSAKSLRKLHFSFKDPENCLFEWIASYPNNNSLEDFSLTTPIYKLTQIKAIQRFVKSHFINLKSLKLNISIGVQEFQEESLILFKRVFQLEGLKKLDLCFKTPLGIVEKDYEHAGNPKNNSLGVIGNLEPALIQFFLKNSGLEEFRFKFTIDPSQRESFFTSVLERAQNLKKLEVEIGNFVCSQTNYNRILLCIKKLKSIEVLKIRGLTITEQEMLRELASRLRRLTFLTIFKFGEITENISPNFFADIMPKVLMSTNINRLVCSLSENLGNMVLNDKKIQRKFEFLCCRDPSTGHSLSDSLYSRKLGVGWCGERSFGYGMRKIKPFKARHSYTGKTVAVSTFPKYIAL